ncbi:MAG: glycosyltransferase family 1 protein [Chloroflexi bacterium]|nr:MAG: glycosyltransferase family 1 protein [Chloroflexota bacterium]MBL1193000.1 glycosyltransferase family 1 protein [Chloroflexota bacterium]NOH10293.1 glycosyltransferase family 1 protein [Chloroflexota bacterium]
MRIAYFTETFLPKIDGIVITLQHLFEYLEDEGHDSIMFAPSGTIDEYAATPIYQHRSVRPPFYPEIRMGNPAARVEKRIKEFQPDLIHLVNPTLLGLAGLRVARKLRIPIVASYHTDMSGFARRWRMGALSETIYRFYRVVHNRADLNLVPSEFTRRQIMAKGFKRVAVWPGGVDLERFTPAKRSETWRERLMDGETDKLLILFVSRLSREKRADMLLPIAKEIDGIRLAIVGDGPHRQHLESLYAGTSTTFTGYLHGEDLACAYSAADLFVFTGAEETYGNVVVEAMASGLPVVAPASGGVVNLVEDGVSGLLYPPEDRRTLTEMVRELVNDPQRTQEMGIQGRVRAEGMGWETTFDALMGRYQRLLNEIRPVSPQIA